MRDLIFYTKEPITKEKVALQIIEKFKGSEVYLSDKQLFIGDAPNSFDLQLNSKENRHNTIEYKPDVDESVKALPNKDAIWNRFGYHDAKIAKKVVRVILDIYPEMWVEDLECEWIGSAKEYLKLKIRNN